MNGLEKAVAVIQALGDQGGVILDRLPESVAQQIQDQLDTEISVTDDLYDELEKEVYVLETQQSAQLVAEDQRIQRIISDLEGESVPMMAFVLQQLDADTANLVMAGLPSAQRDAIRGCELQDNPIQETVAAVIMETVQLD
jgi:hypothetical protein